MSDAVDAWISGGLQFTNGAAYSYVVVVGTGSASDPWAHSLHAAQVAAPLLEELLGDLAVHAKANPRGDLLAPRPLLPTRRVPLASARPSTVTATPKALEKALPVADQQADRKSVV